MIYKKNSLIPPQLSLKSKESLYNSFFFYNLSTFLFFEKIVTKESRSLSFNKVFLNKIFFFENSLMRVRIICLNKSFLYLDSGTKHTLVKPKFRKLLKTLIPTELLFFSYKPFFRVLKFLELKKFIQMFQYTPTKIISSIFTLNKFFYLKKLLENKTKYSNKFFLVALKNKFFSKSQKKMHFLQFITSFSKS